MSLIDWIILVTTLAFIVIYDALATRTTSLLNEIEVKALAMNTATLKKSAL